MNWMEDISNIHIEDISNIHIEENWKSHTETRKNRPSIHVIEGIFNMFMMSVLILVAFVIIKVVDFFGKINSYFISRCDKL